MNVHHAAESIDVVAGRLTEAEPRADLLARVMARIEASPRQSPVWHWHLTASGAALALSAGAALIAVTVNLSGPLPLPPVRAGHVAMSAPRLETLTPTSPDVAPPRMPAAVPAVSPGVVPTSAEREWHSRQLSTLSTPDAISIEVIQPADSTIALLDMSPLSVTPLTIAPVAMTSDGRN